MNVARNRVVSIEFTLTGEDGAVIDTSAGDEPLSYIHGTGTLVDALEAAMEGKGPSDKVSLTLPPEKAYGVRDDSIVFTVPRTQFPADEEPEVGMEVMLQGDGEGRMVTIVDLNDDEVTLDGNHPLAGLTLRFDVEIVDVRDATPEEIEHGHAHDEHGHHEEH
jgi:FKBP-type peptidyl-prolyl cis-trans isomerase SlyD